ncbi:hypothetical protein EVAR_19004_1 [Eumeta japonica]|uniref:Uncharacterized protein n=1 Tax=Eumeta variegata TaxID=151549 RepID=A0A4C1V722_EUMVA|nr:hypothetical protein EVAR_19004_1 [Eumeta japonica]
MSKCAVKRNCPNCHAEKTNKQYPLFAYVMLLPITSPRRDMNPKLNKPKIEWMSCERHLLFHRTNADQSASRVHEHARPAGTRHNSGVARSRRSTD